MQLASSGLTAAGLHGIDALVLATPFLIFHLYALGLRVGLAVAASVIVCHLRVSRGLTSCGMLSLIAGVTNAILCAGFYMAI